ncbi:hypothetical protein, partial [Pseudomonas poae]|uniref:hypothetical protein n=1 Tax=Pseudomonas poae TaxID=200451 RepID=UPI001C838C88
PKPHLRKQMGFCFGRSKNARGLIEVAFNATVPSDFNYLAAEFLRLSSTLRVRCIFFSIVMYL